MICVCASNLSSPKISLATIVNMKSVIEAICSNLKTCHLTLETLWTRFRVGKLYLNCIRLQKFLDIEWTRLISRCGRERKGNQVGDVCFTNEGLEDAWVCLQKFSFKLEAGKSIGLAGLNGWIFPPRIFLLTGKSTFIDFLCSVIKPMSREINMNKIPINGYVPLELRRHFVVLFQKAVKTTKLRWAFLTE